MSPPPRTESPPPFPRISPREAREAVLDSAVRYAAARAARAARLEVLEKVRADPDRVDCFRAVVACAVADGARRVVVLDAGCVSGALAVEAVRAGAEQVVAFEPDPTLATLVRDTARQVLSPAGLRRLVVLDADVSRVEACLDDTGAAWRVRAHDSSAASPEPGAASPRSFVAPKKADCLVLGAFAVADALEMLERSRALAALREAGVFDALLAAPRADGARAFAVIPRTTRVFAQMVAGSNLGDVRRLERLDVAAFLSRGENGAFAKETRPAAARPLTRACPAAALTRVRARFRPDAVTRVSEVFEMTTNATNDAEETNRRHDWVPAFSHRVTLSRPSAPADLGAPRLGATDRRAAEGVASWWWMDVGARWMDGGDGRDDMRDAVVVSSSPRDADAAASDRTVTFSLATTAFRDGRGARSVETERAPAEETRSASTSRACSCAAHALLGVDGVARWNDTSTTERLGRGVAAVTRRAPHVCGQGGVDSTTGTP